MSWRFLRIDKANQEIERLETELKAALDQVKALTENSEAAVKAGETAIADNALLKAQFAEVTAKVTKLEAELKDAQAKTSDFEVKVAAAASAKAREIAASQGIPPLNSPANQNPQKEKATTELKGAARFIAEFDARNAHLVGGAQR